MAQAVTQGGVAVGAGQFVEHVAGGGEQDGVAGEQGLVGEILGDHGLADAVGADQDDVGGSARKSQAHSSSMAARSLCVGQCQSKSARGLKRAEASVAQTAFQAAAGAFLLFPVDQRRQPRARAIPPSGPASLESERLGAGHAGHQACGHRRHLLRGA